MIDAVKTSADLTSPSLHAKTTVYGLGLPGEAAPGVPDEAGNGPVRAPEADAMVDLSGCGAVAIEVLSFTGTTGDP